MTVLLSALGALVVLQEVVALTGPARLHSWDDLATVQGFSNQHPTPVTPLASLRIYVYDMPSLFTDVVLSEPQEEGPKCGRANSYSEELMLHRQMLNSSMRTLDPDTADIFYVPFYIWDHCAPWFEGKCRASLLCKNPSGDAWWKSTPGLALRHVADTWPYFNRSGGADHITTMVADQGRCMLTPAERISFMNVRFLQPSSEYGEGRGCFRPGYDVAIPPMLGETYLSTNVARKDDFLGGPLAVFVGSYAWWAYDATSIQRKMLFQQFGCEKTPAPTCNESACTANCLVPGMIVWDGNTPDYYELLARSRFCLHAEGTVFVSSRLYESIVAGCVPVIYTSEHSARFELPAREVVPYDDIVVYIPESQIDQTPEILRAISDDEYRQRRLAMQRGREALLYRDPPVQGGALHMILQQLSHRLSDSDNSSLATDYDVQTGWPFGADLQAVDEPVGAGVLDTLLDRLPEMAWHSVPKWVWNAVLS